MLYTWIYRCKFTVKQRMDNWEGKPAWSPYLAFLLVCLHFLQLPKQLLLFSSQGLHCVSNPVSGGHNVRWLTHQFPEKEQRLRLCHQPFCWGLSSPELHLSGTPKFPTQNNPGLSPKYPRLLALEHSLGLDSCSFLSVYHFEGSSVDDFLVVCTQSRLESIFL